MSWFEITWFAIQNVGHRVGTADMPAQLTERITNLATAAACEISLQQHSASHPRLGVVDHISCHPIQPVSDLRTASQVAHDIGAALARALPDLPVLMYGAACPRESRLQDVRRACGPLCHLLLIIWADIFCPDDEQEIYSAALLGSSRQAAHAFAHYVSLCLMNLRHGSGLGGSCGQAALLCHVSTSMFAS
jgi:Formiminotransferase domain, N-terminal subdomain